MADILRALKETPLPTLFLVIGFVMLSVGFGLRIRAVIDVDQINKTYAKIIGIVFLLFGLVPYISSFATNVAFGRLDSTDPFLIYYLICVPLVVVMYMVVLKTTNGEMQVRAAKHSFIFVGCLVTIVVIWRAMDVYFYLDASDKNLQNMPLGLCERRSYIPYFALLGTGIMAIILGIYKCTHEQLNRQNRSIILDYFVWSCVYLAICRLAWEFVDYIARMRISCG